MLVYVKPICFKNLESKSIRYFVHFENQAVRIKWKGMLIELDDTQKLMKCYYLASIS
jgi:hypothetical protein